MKVDEPSTPYHAPNRLSSGSSSRGSYTSFGGPTDDPDSGSQQDRRSSLPRSLLVANNDTDTNNENDSSQLEVHTQYPFDFNYLKKK